jgi:hypothetical protein
MGRPRKHFPLSEYPHTKLRNCEACGRLFVPRGSKHFYCTPACNIACNTVVNHDTGCVEWTGYCRPSGHGQLNAPDGYERTGLVHRLVFIMHHGPIPDGLVVRHRCDNPPCCNIEHLELGTQAQNVADAQARDRHQRGSRNGHAKLIEDDIRAMKQKRRAGALIADLAAEYKLSIASVSMICNGRIWRHVKE